MNREQLAHILRAATTIVDDGDILVIGSQAILATYDESELPEAAIASIEADLAFLDDADNTKSDAVDGANGELSPFHAMLSKVTVPHPTRRMVRTSGLARENAASHEQPMESLWTRNTRLRLGFRGFQAGHAGSIPVARPAKRRRAVGCCDHNVSFRCRCGQAVPPRG
jgi:hypothetical protein